MKAALKIISLFVIAGSCIALGEYDSDLLRRLVSYLPKDPNGIAAEVTAFFDTVTFVGCGIGIAIFIAVLIACGKNSSH